MTLQNHIHMSLTINTVGEKAPSIKWKTKERIDTPQVFHSIEQTLNGRLKIYRLREAGEPVKLLHMNYILVIRPEFSYTVEDRLAQLDEMLGKIVYLVDHFHCPDGQDHTPFIKPYYFEDRSPFKPWAQMMHVGEVEIKLRDASRT